jgi:serine/threonine-protein kinase
MLVGQQLGPFAVEKELGSGAMGAVYLARYTKTNQRVAVKIMAPGLGCNEKALERFEREAEILKKLRHPNIVRLFGHGRFHGTPYYAMEYIEGESLDRVMQRRGRFPWEEVVGLGQQLCDALQEAHQQGIIHRDLKPSNLMLLPNGTLKLTDFGIARDLSSDRLTSAYCTVGTAAYMSPEQCRGEANLTHKSDLYSVGVLLYELLTGTRPFQATTAMEVFHLHAEGTFERPTRMVLDIPVWLDTLVCQLLEKKPEHRPFDAATVALALDQVVEKVSAQQSAGVEAVQARAANRLSGVPAPDEADRDVARSLRAGMRHRRRRHRHRRSRPFYAKVWFHAVLLVVFLASVVGLIVWLLLPPSANKLHSQAQQLMASHQFHDHLEARRGPIQKYLEYYGDRDDPQTREVRAWADRVDLEQLERQLDNRYRNDFQPEGPAEPIAFVAQRFEEEGNLEAAMERWRELERGKDAKEGEERIWSLLAGKRLKQLEEVEQKEKEIRGRMEDARQKARDWKPESTLVRRVGEALQAESFGDLSLTRDRWEQLKNENTKDKTQRVWGLLATKKLSYLQVKAPRLEPEIEQQVRRDLVQAQLSAALTARETGNLRQARYLLQDIVELYRDLHLKDAEIGAAYIEARKILGQMTGNN